MSAVGQKRSFFPGQLNGRFWTKADIPLKAICGNRRSGGDLHRLPAALNAGNFQIIMCVLAPGLRETRVQSHFHTILVVEDELLVRMMIADALRNAGFEVLEAGSSEEALRILEGGAT